MISLKGITKTFNRGSPNEIRLFENLSLEIDKNDFIVVIGSNGSGKTSLLNILAGTIRHDKGIISLDGKDISAYKDFERSKWIARIFQNPLAGTAPELTILENFRLASLRTKRKGLSIGTGAKFRSLVQEKIAVLGLGLEDKAGQKMGSLSGGQRQALALLMAIMDDTKLLLLDEPAAALDPRTSVLIMQLAEKVIREFGLTALLVTHNLKDVTAYGNRVVQMKEGKIIRDLRKDVTNPLNTGEIYEWFSE